MNPSEIDDLVPLIDLAERLADAAAAETLPRFRSARLVADDKGAGGVFDPVTEADRASEAAMRALLAAERPDDGILGEEDARIESRSGLTWVLDPIDGTRAFISGLPVWGTLIALDDGTRGRIGVFDQPFTGERFLGVVDGTLGRAELRRGGGTRSLSSRQGVALSDAIFCTTDPFLFEGEEQAVFQGVRARARLTRYGMDCYAYGLLALGRVDLVIESGLAAYDIAAHVPIIEAAGGIVTDWEGKDCRWGGRAVAAGSRALHEEVLEVLASVG